MAASSLPPPALAPTRVGRYDIMLPIGRGGAASVYLARMRGVAGFERDVALKLVARDTPEDEAFSAELIEEAKLAAAIRHPHVVTILDVGTDALGVYLVMDYVDGENLSGLLRQSQRVGNALAAPVRMRVLLDALDGLHAAHEARDEEGRELGLIHRDFTPQNILVGRDGHARLGDFGIARATTRANRTATGLVKGKIRYMAPEQARGHALDRRCDVWAAGVIAWEMLADRRLWEGDNDIAIALAVVSDTPPLLSSVMPSIPDDVDDAIAWALVPAADKRCPTAAELARRLGAACERAGLLAKRSEVALAVEELMGEELEQRRASAGRATVVEPAPDLETASTLVRSPGKRDEGRRRRWSIAVVGAAIAAAALAGRLSAGDSAVAKAEPALAALAFPEAPPASLPPASAPTASLPTASVPTARMSAALPTASAHPVAPRPAPPAPRIQRPTAKPAPEGEEEPLAPSPYAP